MMHVRSLVPVQGKRMWASMGASSAFLLSRSVQSTAVLQPGAMRLTAAVAIKAACPRRGCRQAEEQGMAAAALSSPPVRSSSAALSPRPRDK